MKPAPLTKWELFSLLAATSDNARPRHFGASNGQVYFGFLLGASREDGTGSSFNITVSNQSGCATFHLRTID